MILYSLTCDSAHRFDGWFGNAEAYEQQRERGLVTCPVCASSKVEKAPMAPALGRPKAEAGDTVALAGPAGQKRLRAALRALREKIVSEADYVGDRFAEEARRIHFEEAEARGIYGEATREEVAGLLEDGIDVLPLPSVPEEHN